MIDDKPHFPGHRCTEPADHGALAQHRLLYPGRTSRMLAPGDHQGRRFSAVEDCPDSPSGLSRTFHEGTAADGSFRQHRLAVLRIPCSGNSIPAYPSGRAEGSARELTRGAAGLDARSPYCEVSSSLLWTMTCRRTVDRVERLTRPPR